MNKIVLAAVFMAMAVSFFGCATRYPMTGPDALKGWSQFVGEEVISVQEVYSFGDAPRNLIKTKSGASRIY